MQTNKQTDMLITIHSTPGRDEVIIFGLKVPVSPLAMSMMPVYL